MVYLVWGFLLMTIWSLIEVIWGMIEGSWGLGKEPTCLGFLIVTSLYKSLKTGR